MKIDAIQAYHQAYPIKNNARIKNTTPVEGIEQPQGTSFVHLSFKGNPDKIPTQIAAFATECNFLGGIYCSGGLGDVASLFPEFVGLKSKEVVGKDVDMRTFLPYYSMDDDAGRVYVLTKDGAEKKKNLKKGEKLQLKRDFKLVDVNYKLQEGEQFAVITKISGDGVEKNVEIYHMLKETGLEGTSERMAEKDMKMEKIPYRVFEVDTAGKREDKLYLIHTPEHAKGKSAYGVYRTHAQKQVITTAAGYGPSATAYGPASTAYGPSSEARIHVPFTSPKTDDMFMTEQLRAYEQLTMEGKMNTDAHGKFNPQNHLFHDRFCYMALTDAAQKAKNGDKNYQGLVFDEILHNPGAAYQGKYANPLDFFRIIATDKDLAKLQANEHYNKVTEIAGKIENGKATKEECTQLYKFFKPYFSKFMDTEGLFNMTMIAVRMTDENEKNSSLGNVSRNYGKETRNLETVDIAKGLTQPLIDIQSKTIDVVNGSKKANMDTEGKGEKSNFGSGTLNKRLKIDGKYQGYSATDSVDKIYKAKLENKKNVIQELADATKKLSSDNDAIAKVFFSNDKIAKLRKNATNAGDPDVKLILGSMSEYKDGDMLFVGWGRPDPQKGMPVTLEGFENVLKDESIPLETRKHLKLVIGTGSAGEDMFTKASNEWKAIEEIVNRIETMDGGKFKGQCIYTNGTFPARLANCADLGILTSRFEPCGITPLECFASGTPVLSTNTGGAPDFVRPGINGFLTKDPFMLNPEKVGLAAGTEGEALDKARRSHVAKQVAEELKKFVDPVKDKTWEAKQKEFIKNCAGEKIEWHNNNAYNGGRSALEIYLKDKLNVMNNDVPNEYVSDMRGEFDNTAFTKTGTKSGTSFGAKIKNFFHSKAGKWTAGIAGTAALISIGYAGYKKGIFSTKYDEKKEDEHKPSLSEVA